MFRINHELEVTELSLEQLEEIQGGKFFVFRFIIWVLNGFFGNDARSQPVSGGDESYTESYTQTQFP